MSVDVLELATVPTVVMLVQLLKTSLRVDGHWSSLLSLVVGVGVTALVGWQQEVFALADVLVKGLLMGLAASGSYSGYKSVTATDVATAGGEVVDFND